MQYPLVFGVEGGPCGGKSTFIDYFEQQAAAQGVSLCVLPEVASEVIAELRASGSDIRDILADPEENFVLQRRVLGTIAERLISAREALGPTGIVIADRVDNAAYMSPALYGKVTDSLGFTVPPMNELVDQILYFPTLAYTNPERYLQLVSTNPNRYESADDAVQTCCANLGALALHPNVVTINGSLQERLVTASDLIFAAVLERSCE